MRVGDSVDTVLASASGKATGAGSILAAVSGFFSSSSFGMWAGILIGLGGLWLNAYYRRRDDRRAEEEHRRQEELAKAKLNYYRQACVRPLSDKEELDE